MPDGPSHAVQMATQIGDAMPSRWNQDKTKIYSYFFILEEAKLIEVMFIFCS